ncbi:hypothetical protein E2P81_ATG09149 [Venturia nashicola]|uniref:Uncharacterized protein n=1 Tax=Venturia nashicola TaxID=86259 RepID=A0A4Z1NTI0_9PEZI|nr:hypothetical protein E6O75_ATG09349 [Venturia nashicola]TLD20079.1 hypothetical protein E2P81_ATG09149 [Venturia nashicola]
MNPLLALTDTPSGSTKIPPGDPFKPTYVAQYSFGAGPTDIIRPTQPLQVQNFDFDLVARTFFFSEPLSKDVLLYAHIYFSPCSETNPTIQMVDGTIWVMPLVGGGWLTVGYALNIHQRDVATIATLQTIPQTPLRRPTSPDPDQMLLPSPPFHRNFSFLEWTSASPTLPPPLLHQRMNQATSYKIPI